MKLNVFHTGNNRICIFFLSLCSHQLYARFEKNEINTFLLFDVLNKRRCDSALNRRDLYTGGHNDWLSFQIKSRLMINILFLRASINDSLTTLGLLGTHPGLGWSQWGYRWIGYERLMGDELVFCGVASALCVRAAAYNHASDDWQLAVFSLWSIPGKINDLVTTHRHSVFSLQSFKKVVAQRPTFSQQTLTIFG